MAVLVLSRGRSLAEKKEESENIDWIRNIGLGYGFSRNRN